MIQVSEPINYLPKEYKSPLHEMICRFLEENKIPFSRVENEPAVTMEDCIAIDKALDVKTAKTLFLCNRQKTNYYLFVTAGNKPFVTKNFSSALGISRVSFASAEMLNEIIGTEIGGATVFGVLRPQACDVQVVFDKEVCDDEWFGCTDGTPTGYMKLRTSDILEKLLPISKHSYKIIDSSRKLED